MTTEERLAALEARPVPTSAFYTITLGVPLWFLLMTVVKLFLIPSDEMRACRALGGDVSTMYLQGDHCYRVISEAELKAFTDTAAAEVSP